MPACIEAAVIDPNSDRHSREDVCRNKPGIGTMAVLAALLLWLAGCGSNMAIGLMALLGPCSGLSGLTSVVVNEFTTIPAQSAVAQFSDSSGQILGTSFTNSSGLANAANQVTTELVNGATGGPGSFWPASSECGSGTHVINCDGVERLNSWANIQQHAKLQPGERGTEYIPGDRNRHIGQPFRSERQQRLWMRLPSSRALRQRQRIDGEQRLQRGFQYLLRCLCSTRGDSARCERQPVDRQHVPSQRDRMVRRQRVHSRLQPCGRGWRSQLGCD